MKEKDIEKYLDQTTWYHGTTLSSWEKLCELKVQHDYNKGIDLDFGYGFYLTPKKKQAESYIKRIIPYSPASNEKDLIPIVIEFELNLRHLLDKYTIAYYPHYDEEFAEFIIKNRMNRNKLIHNNDMVLGVMSDSNPAELLREFNLHMINKDELIRSLIKWTSMEQSFLHNQEICDILIVKRATIIDSGKELNVDDYNKGTRIN